MYEFSIVLIKVSIYVKDTLLILHESLNDNRQRIFTVYQNSIYSLSRNLRRLSELELINENELLNL